MIYLVVQQITIQYMNLLYFIFNDLILHYIKEINILVHYKGTVIYKNKIYLY